MYGLDWLSGSSASGASSALSSIPGLGPIIGSALGGLSMWNQREANDANLTAALQSMQFSGLAQREAQDFANHQGFLSRQYSAQEAQKARDFTNYQVDRQQMYNTDEAQKARDFIGYQANQDRAYSSHEAVKAREFNELQARAQRDWQERMSNTAYQRATSDMRSAGINPMVAYMQGGASTPSGGQASGPAASHSGGGTSQASAGLGGTSSGAGAGLVGSPGFARGDKAFVENVMRGAFNSAVDFMRVDEQNRNMRQNTKVQEEEEVLRGKQTRKEIALGDYYDQLSKQSKAETAISQARFNREKTDSNYYDPENKVSKWGRYAHNFFSDIGPGFNTAKGVVDMMTGAGANLGRNIGRNWRNWFGPSKTAPHDPNLFQ